MDLLHNYAFSEGKGIWYGNEVWNVAMLEENGHYTDEGNVPWVSEHGAKFYQNGNICIAVTGCGADAKYTFSMPSPGEEADEVELTAVFTHVFGSAIVPDDEIEE